MKKVIFLFFIFISLTSCFDEASFELTNGRVVTVDRQSLDEFEAGQKVWLIKGYAPGASDWEILSEFDISQIGFEPEKDTILVFNSQASTYKRRIALGTLIKKK